MRLGFIENLSCSIPIIDTLADDKQGICRHHFINSGDIQVWKSVLDVSPKWAPYDHSSCYCGSFLQSFLYYSCWSPTRIGSQSFRIHLIRDSVVPGCHRHDLGFHHGHIWVHNTNFAVKLHGNVILGHVIGQCRVSISLQKAVVIRIIESWL